ncbi:MAG: NAD(P)(+) transhydrogenase (Re/Si-specific) subunit beta [Planctomycetia bacterium]|nr:NAD(P)(+) transhydrogenase (Re/Si-specific) subunit beta [Planctomycetia bacterium]
MIHTVVQLSYVVATALFVFSLHWMNDPKTARRGVTAGIAGMVLAVLATWIQPEIRHHLWIVGAIAAGFLVGVPLSRVPLTAVPQRTALSHAFGGLAAGLVGTAEYFLWLAPGSGSRDVAAALEHLTPFRMTAIVAEIILGFVTFTGSLMAAGKLQEVKWIPQRPVTYPLQNVGNIAILVLAAALGVLLVFYPAAPWSPVVFLVVAALATLFGVLLIIPIGGADMPTVISILNSYAGLSAVAMGFVLDNKLLITAGALDGSSGLILSIIMCRAMNRSFTNVLFGAFGQVQRAAAGGEQKDYKTETVEGAAQILEMARTVVVIPGYGMAVAQAQHKVRDLYDQLKKRGIAVKFAIHPVAGRMPGHMNVLLAEAEIPYTDLVEMDEINAEMPQVDVALVIGANDVVNPAARHDKSSPIYGMPIIDADRARTVFAIKRSKNPGFAGIDNDLYFQDTTWMLFGDAKAVVGDLVKELAGGNGMH